MATNMQPDPPPSSTRLWPAVVAVVSMSCVLALIGFVVVRTVRGDDDTEASPAVTQATPGEVRLEPVTYRNPDPFTESVVTATEADLLAAAASGDDMSGTVSGDTTLLYAGRRGGAPCDVERLANLLTQDRSTTAAWAAAAGVEPGSVGDTVRSYTPVLLTADTAVTNHTYRDGTPNAYQSVLQAGTPVLIDDQGTPRAQCSCGNPLLPPTSVEDADYRGEPWDTFDPDEVVQVEPATTSRGRITVVDLDGGEPVELPPGGTVELDGLLAVGEHGVSAVADDGTVTQLIDEPVEAAHDDGAGGLVYTLQHDRRNDDGYLDGPPSDRRRATIWHLPAGESEAVELVAAEAPGGWNQLFGVGQLGDATIVVFAPLVTEAVYDGIDAATGPLVALDLASGERTQLLEYGLGWELGIPSVSFGGDLLAVQAGDIYPDWLLFDGGLQRVPNRCSSGGEAEDAEIEFIEANCPWSGALNDEGTLTFLGSELSDGFVLGEETIRTIDLESGMLGEPVVADYTADTAQTSSMLTQAVGDRIAVEFRLASESVRPSGQALNSDGTFVDIPEDLLATTHQVRLLTAPLVRPLASSPNTGADDAPDDGPAPRPQIDPLNLALPAGACPTGDGRSPALDLMDGSASTGEDTSSTDFVSIELSDDAVVWADLDRDGREELVVAVVCNWGGSGWANSILALTVEDDATAELAAPPLEQYGRSTRAVGSLSADDNLLVVSGGEWTESDALCCPSSTFTARWALEGGTWTER